MDRAIKDAQCDLLNASGFSGFPSLPLDLLLHLFNLLNPLDIIALRKTCRTLHQATLQRQVWLNTLRRVCVTNSVYAPSFPLTEMTLLELEHAAVLPSLWRSIGSATDKSVPGGDDEQWFCGARRTISLGGAKLKLKHGWNTSSRDLFLVPGGRYLIHFCDDRISLYDLGHTPHSPLLDHARVEAQLEYGGIYLVHPSPDGSALRIFLSIRLTDDERNQLGLNRVWHKFQVYEIYPHHDHPRFELLSQWSAMQTWTSPINLYSIHLNRVVIKFGNVVTVWDFVAATSASWRVVGNFHRIIIADDTIILFGNTGISVWSMPALLPHDHEHTTLRPHADIPILNPLFGIDYPGGVALLDDNPFSESVIRGPSNWYTEPWCYDIVSPSKAGFAISHYLVVLNEDMTGGTIKKTASYELMITPGMHIDDIFINCYCIYHDQLVLCWGEEFSIKVYAFAFSSQENIISTPDKFLTLGKVVEAVSLCPFSARHCLLSADEIIVHDFRFPLFSSVQSGV